MRILNDVTKSWRDFFYANQGNYEYEPKDFLIALELIGDSRSDILDAVMDDDPDREAIIKDAKEEISFQREKIEEMVKGFIEFTSVDKSTFDVQATIDYIIDYNTKSEFYIVIDEWKEWGGKAHKIWDNLSNMYGNGLSHIYDDLCTLIMNEVYDYPKNEGVDE